MPFSIILRAAIKSQIVHPSASFPMLLISCLTDTQTPALRVIMTHKFDTDYTFQAKVQ